MQISIFLNAKKIKILSIVNMIDCLKIKNFINEDPVLDWLELYGKSFGYQKDTECIDFDESKNFVAFINSKRQELKDSITFDVNADSSDLYNNYINTKNFIQLKKNVIKNAMIIDKFEKLYSKCDFLILEDGKYIPGLVRYTTFKKTKKFMYPLVLLAKLCDLQNVDYGYLITRNGKQKIQLEPENLEKFDEAITFYKKMKSQGKKWKLGVDLFSNMSNKNDFPWHTAKKKIALDTNEITLVWNCGIRKRKELHKKGIFSYKKIKLESDTNTNKIINNIIDTNVKPSSVISPLIISNNYKDWKTKEYLEFFVDFENTSNLVNKVEMVFQIGCGYLYENKWIYKSFIANDICPSEEKRIVSEWINYMNTVKIKLRFRKKERVFHWSHSEVTSFNKIKEKYHLSTNLNWFDLIKIFQIEPITVKGCLNYGLKNIAKAFKKHSLIETTWDDTYSDGLGVMTCVSQNDNIKNPEIMYDIIKYNEIDCKVMCEILDYLRKNHI